VTRETLYRKNREISDRNGVGNVDVLAHRATAIRHSRRESGEKAPRKKNPTTSPLREGVEALRQHQIFSENAQSILDGSSTLRTCQVRRRQRVGRQLHHSESLSISLTHRVGPRKDSRSRRRLPGKGSVPDGSTLTESNPQERGFSATASPLLLPQLLVWQYGREKCRPESRVWQASLRKLPPDSPRSCVTSSRHNTDVNGHRPSKQDRTKRVAEVWGAGCLTGTAL
jgi:hypothetical protein